MDTFRNKLVTVILPCLSALLTVLLVIPGNQGESILSQVIEMLKAMAGGT